MSYFASLAPTCTTGSSVPYYFYACVAKGSNLRLRMGVPLRNQTTAAASQTTAAGCWVK